VRLGDQREFDLIERLALDLRHFRKTPFGLAEFLAL
jgi:hypothetical protein